MLLYPENLTQKIGFEAVRESTMLGILTNMGAEHLESLHPTADMVELRNRLESTEEMVRILQLGEGLPLEGLYDIRQAVKRSRVQRSILDPQSLLHIGAMATASRRIKQFFQSKVDLYPRLAITGNKLIPIKELEAAIQQVLSESGEVKDAASNTLRNIRRSMHQRKGELRTTLDRIMREAARNEMTGDEGMTIRNGRMVIPVKAEYKRKIQGFIHDVSSTGQTVYLEPVEALHLNNEIRQLEIQEAQEIERLLMELTDMVRKYADSLHDNCEHIGELDLIHAIGRFSYRLNGQIPEWGTAQLKLIRAKNPHLLLKKLRDLTRKEEVVPLDLDLDSNERCLLITGPNAGGKSVALKTLGLCAIMLQCGYAIPVADGTQMPVFDSIFIDLGDDQSVEQDLSTFSSRLTWMRDTLSKAKQGSLVLIDEAGTGTDPEEGAALYQAFMETMMERGVLVLATTHHGHLKIFAHDHPMAVNASMEFDPISLSPTYIFRKGVPGSSYAFEIAARIGVDNTLLDRARSKIGKSKNRVESLILELQTKTREADLAAFQAGITLREVEKQRTDLETKQKAIINEQTKLRQKALQEARNIVLGAQKQVDDAVKQIKKSGGDKEIVKSVRKKVRDTVAANDNELQQIEEQRLFLVSGDPPVPGDMIRFLDGKSTGELLELSGKQAVVLVNGMRMKTRVDKLVKVTEQAPKPTTPMVRVMSSASMPVPIQVPITLDIRGMRADEAEKKVVRYIDDVIQTGLHQVEIIHGKGDGILRKIVHDHLATRGNIRKYYTPRWDMGGPGVTVIEV
jgi:DNA mismatch repair protein MutS2